MKEEAVDRAIMVAGSNLTPFARSVVAEIAGKQTVEVFLEAELLVNITRHVQRVLNGKDAKMDRLILLPSNPSGNAQRVVLNGNLHPSEPARLNLYLTRTK